MLEFSTNDWNVEHTLRDKGNMRRGKFHGLSGGPFLWRVGAGLGGGDGVRGWLILEKNYTCTLKRVLHNSSVQKKNSRTFSGLKKKSARDAPWVDSMNFISLLL